MIAFLSILGIVVGSVVVVALLAVVIPLWIDGYSETGRCIYYCVLAALTVSLIIYSCGGTSHSFNVEQYIYDHGCRITESERTPDTPVVSMVNNTPITTIIPGNIQYHYECRDANFWR